MLTEERWQHILDHPEHSDDAVDRVAETIRDPERVVGSRIDPSVELFYRWYQNTLVGDKYLCIVIKAQVEDPFILTAYFTDTIKQGKELWNKQDEP